jgi:CDP-diacylglycerol pyrophosphatase
VHGLALPRERVAGIEDAKRPAGLWQFAWSTAAERITDTSSIALIVNPVAWRTQDQLHIHILRLRSDARARLAAKAVHLGSLATTWTRAAEAARAASLGERYGVLVMLDSAGGYLLYVDASPLEHLYAEGWCT